MVGSRQTAAGLFPRFDRRFFEGDETFTQIGAGDLGGKALGLAFVRESVIPGLGSQLTGATVDVPVLTVIATDAFDAFMARNKLMSVVSSGAPDDRIVLAFLHAELPVEILGDLRGLIERVHTPLAIRSSSLLEDALAHPLAGVYGTKMIPNNQHGADNRFRKLVDAIKFVYASTFLSSARSYRESIGASSEQEKMAVIVQEVVGNRYGEHFYPEISGVARSYNHYPPKHSDAGDGVVNVAFGLGKTVVDGEACWTYVPRRPTAPPPFNSPRDQLRNTQTTFWSVNMGAPVYSPLRETECLRRLPVVEAETHGSLRFVASTYDASSDKLYAGVTMPGPRLLNFAPILSHGLIPLNDCLEILLMKSKEAAGCEVEIEFALKIDPSGTGAPNLGFLQLRPMAKPSSEVRVGPDELRGDRVVLASENCLGNGHMQSITDIVFLKPEAFAAHETPSMARELSVINRSLVQEDRGYVLLGFGRWGSSDPWLGVPVTWGDVSGARVIVEATASGMNPEMSQGAHFFHNLISLEVLYLSIPSNTAIPVDWDWLNSQHTIAETKFIKHVRARNALTVRVDGFSRRGVITYDD